MADITSNNFFSNIEKQFCFYLHFLRKHLLRLICARRGPNGREIERGRKRGEETGTGRWQRMPVHYATTSIVSKNWMVFVAFQTYTLTWKRYDDDKYQQDNYTHFSRRTWLAMPSRRPLNCLPSFIYISRFSWISPYLWNRFQHLIVYV